MITLESGVNRLPYICVGADGYVSFISKTSARMATFYNSSLTPSVSDFESDLLQNKTAVL